MDESKDDIRRRRQKEFDAKEQVGYPDALKSDAEKLLECREAIAMYQSIVMDQEIRLVDLQVEACLRANEFTERSRTAGECEERIEVLEDLLQHYKTDYTAAFKEIKRLRRVIQDNA